MDRIYWYFKCNMSKREKSIWLRLFCLYNWENGIPRKWTSKELRKHKFGLKIKSWILDIWCATPMKNYSLYGYTSKSGAQKRIPYWGYIFGSHPNEDIMKSTRPEEIIQGVSTDIKEESSPTYITGSLSWCKIHCCILQISLHYLYPIRLIIGKFLK